jgi:adenylate cyclase
VLEVKPSLQLTSIDVIASALEPILPDVGQMSSPDGATTLMLSDIVDAAVAAAQFGPERWDRLVRDHHAIVEQIVDHHGGQVARFEGDGFLANFNSAHGGLHAAVELQETFSADTGGVQQLATRIGMHSGFVIAGPESLLGRNIVLAARIAAQARGGEILVSSSLKQYTESDQSFTFESRGEHHFKGLHGEHEVYAVRWR